MGLSASKAEGGFKIEVEGVLSLGIEEEVEGVLDGEVVLTFLVEIVGMGAPLFATTRMVTRTYFLVGCIIYFLLINCSLVMIT